jgi:hypothetical protein
MSAPGPGSIFVCYRRSDSADTVDRIYELLEKDFDRRGLFRDIDSIPLGIDFPSHITRVLEACSVVLVVIGPGWLDARTEDGQRRLDNPRDHVRMEIEAALRVQGLRVIPILVRNASMPRSEQLPDTIQGLVGRSGLSIRPNPDFRGDMFRLARKLREAIANRTDHRDEPTDPELRWLPLLSKWSFSPFLLGVLSFFLPFQQNKISGRPIIGLEALYRFQYTAQDYCFLFASLCLTFTLVSSFFNYHLKIFLEAIVSVGGFVLLLYATGRYYESGDYDFGLAFTSIFQAVGALMKTFLFIKRRKLPES